MADTFNELVTRTRDWLNRSTDVLSDAVLQDCIRWSADDAYRTLRIPPLEANVVFTGLGQLTPEQPVGIIAVTSIAAPSDLIEVIKIRTTDANGKTIRMINSDGAWTRKSGRIYISTQVGINVGVSGSSETHVELFYYRRLPALDALYTAEAVNFNISGTYLGLAPVQAGSAATGEGFIQILDSALNPITEDPPLEATVFALGNTAVDTTLTAVDPATGVIKFSGKTPKHWLLNENEKLLIYGGLAESFAYLQEDDQSQKYKQRFMEEIAELNDEDVRRNAAGGTIQMNFNGRGLI